MLFSAKNCTLPGKEEEKKEGRGGEEKDFLQLLHLSLCLSMQGRVPEGIKVKSKHQPCVALPCRSEQPCLGNANYAAPRHLRSI